MLTLKEKAKIVFLAIGLLLLIASAATFLPQRNSGGSPRVDAKFPAAVAATSSPNYAVWLFLGGGISLLASFLLRDE